MHEQLPLFEGHRPTQARLSITGGFATVDGASIGPMKLGTRVRFLVEGEVKSVQHKLYKDGIAERQHVVVLDGFTTDEDYPLGKDTTVSINGSDPVPLEDFVDALQPDPAA